MLSSRPYSILSTLNPIAFWSGLRQRGIRVYASIVFDSSLSGPLENYVISSFPKTARVYFSCPAAIWSKPRSQCPCLNFHNGFITGLPASALTLFCPIINLQPKVSASVGSCLFSFSAYSEDLISFRVNARVLSVTRRSFVSFSSHVS